MITDHELANERSFATVKAGIFESAEDLRRDFGETGQAIREKVREFEIWSRDHFVPIPTFDRAYDQLCERVDVMAEIAKLSEQMQRN